MQDLYDGNVVFVFAGNKKKDSHQQYDRNLLFIYRSVFLWEILSNLNQVDEMVILVVGTDGGEEFLE